MTAAQLAAFEASLVERNLAGARLGYGLSAVLMPAGFALDWVTEPGQVGRFFLVRMCAGLVALLLLAVSHWSKAERHPVLLGAGPPILCATGIEILILRLNGVVSPYYAGLNLCILAVAVLYVWRWQRTLLVSSAIVGIWLAPAVPQALSGTLPFAPFFNNLYFLSLTLLITVASSVIRYRAAQGEFTARLGLSETTAELSSTLTRLRELDRLKNEFFANVSHELRTPLTLILTPVDDLLGRELPADLRPSLTVVRRNAHRLLRLIDDLLDLARLDVGGLRLHVAELDLNELVTRVVEVSRPAAEAQRLSLQVETAPGELTIHGDPHRLEMVLTNLLGNAIKFTPDGGRVRVVVKKGTDSCHVEVHDSGPGIAPAELEHIFERFYQVEGSERRRQGGAGIGLSLARKLAELHGGGVSVASKLGQGSTFSVMLPLGREHFRDEVLERRRVKTDEHPNRRKSDRSGGSARPEPLVEPPAEREAPPVRMDRGRRPIVLVAEDEPDLREYIEATLRPQFDVIAASDGAQALELVRARAPDLVLTDFMMPGTSGTDLCRAIKQDSRLRSTPVVVLTALSATDNVLEAYSAGADDFVTKPFHSRVLSARINAQLRLRSVGLQLADQARLATAGTLAGGVAHEVRNPLNAVLNAARALAEPGGGRPELRAKLLGIIVEGSQRIDRIVGALEEHVRPAEENAILQCDLQSGLRSSIELLSHKMSDVNVHLVCDSTRSVLASPRELNQVFLNLLDNAVRAGAKNIWIGTSDRGSGVRVSVSDDGPGVSKEVAELIFEPFFTTRPVGEGTGLGLYLSRRIIREYGGDLTYAPREGGGAVFGIELPAIEAAA